VAPYGAAIMAPSLGATNTVSGMLNGIFGSGERRHIAVWQPVKVVDRSEETGEDGTIVRRERERFTNELTLAYASGETAILR
jgi:hypothetical protein